MSTSRREFIQRFGIALAGAVLGGCVPAPTPAVTCYAPVAPTFIATPPGSPAREAVRAAWLRLEELVTLTRKDDTHGSALKDDLLKEHRAALDELVAAG